MLKNKIVQEMKEALKARQAEKLSVIRMLLAEIKQKEIDGRTMLYDNDIISLIVKMIKQRQESVKIYEQVQRSDLAFKESQEIAVLQQYLPIQLDESTIREKVSAAIQALNVVTKADMGKVMSVLKTELAGQADMSLVSQLVKEHLK